MKGGGGGGQPGGSNGVSFLFDSSVTSAACVEYSKEYPVTYRKKRVRHVGKMGVRNKNWPASSSWGQPERRSLEMQTRS